jgi:hypothetical protein
MSETQINSGSKPADDEHASDEWSNVVFEHPAEAAEEEEPIPSTERAFPLFV